MPCLRVSAPDPPLATNRKCNECCMAGQWCIMLAPMKDLVSIPVRDIREGGPVRYAIEGRERAGALRDECLTWLLPPARLLLPAMDWVTRRWLERSCSPYVAEMECIAAALELPGAWFLNGSYEWGCTAVAREEEGQPWLARTLDW